MQNRLTGTLSFADTVEKVRLVSPARVKALNKLGIYTIEDLVNHFPRRYIDLSHVEKINKVRIGETNCIFARVHEIKLKHPKPRLALVELTIVDGTGTCIVTCFKQPWLMNQIHADDMIAVAGKVEFNYGYKRMTNPYIEIIENGDVFEGEIIPVHGACEKISPAWMRRLVANALQECSTVFDSLPVYLRVKHNLMSKHRALRCMHFPQTLEEMKEAKRRLAFEEVFYLEVMLMEENLKRQTNHSACTHKVTGEKVKALRAALPFVLTGDQESAISDIFEHMSKPLMMNHLLLGDVGTGKTAVSALAIAAAADNGKQCMFLAPTEVLAQQHFESLSLLFNQCSISTALLTGSVKSDERRKILKAFQDGTVDVLIGTHALLEPDVCGNNISLLIIDEQQRFGVSQREVLIEKSPCADVLYLTATPIPRTLALTVYGNLTLSYLHEKPYKESNRITRVLKKGDVDIAYSAIEEAITQGHQAYIVCPLIGQKAACDEDEIEEHYEYATIEIDTFGVNEDIDYLSGENSISAAEQLATILSTKRFPGVSIEVLHGKLSSEEKTLIMKRFNSGETKILIATTVIEVGINVPNATVMVIQDADRFGLSQLHQLRGRVGRGSDNAEIYLISDTQSPDSLARLKAMETCEDGFELASYDLSLRREGDLLGNRQHGISTLKLVNVIRDKEIIEKAHSEAYDLVNGTAECSKEELQILKNEINRIYEFDHVRLGG